MKTAAIYARVSSDQQREEHTIASQTAALVEFAKSTGYAVPDEWIFQDEGFSGASLVRPGLERVRDLAAEGQIQALLVLSPDRLSRKYAYQVLLIEELTRQGVETVFLKAPQANTPEDQLLLQFQGMIAEYERAQILERSRRGKRHRARQGEVSVLSGAPYGYRYVRKTEDRLASYEVIDAEAKIVQQLFQLYALDGLSIGEVTRKLNEEGVATRKGGMRWERSTVWAILRNPAYRGMACFGKTQQAPRQRVNSRTLRRRGALPGRNSVGHELPRDQWIEIPVPALVDEPTFALAQERLASNQQLAARRTVEPSIVQGLVHCQQCGYALYRTSTRSSARKIYYYRCIGSDAWRFDGVARCDQRPIRLDLLEHVVWTEIVRLLEDPSLIQAELERRHEAARKAHPGKAHQAMLERDLAQVRKRMDRLLTAYQDELLTLDELRQRLPELRKRERGLQSDLEALREKLDNDAGYLRLTETLTGFLERLRANGRHLDVADRQRITRLLVKEVVVGDHGITIRHSIPMHTSSPPSGSHESGGYARGANAPPVAGGYLLRPWRAWAALRHAQDRGLSCLAHANPGLEVAVDQPQQQRVGHVALEPRDQPVVIDPIKERFQIKIDHPATTSADVRLHLPHGLVGRALRTKPVAAGMEVRFPLLAYHLSNGLLDEPVEHCGNTQQTRAPIGLGDLHAAHRLRAITACYQLCADLQPVLS
jgi:site-specific DNA recombinase